ncbi:hypothetical protein PRNP1_007468 [Phytophthora ramorum]
MKREDTDDHIPEKSSDLTRKKKNQEPKTKRREPRIRRRHTPASPQDDSNEEQVWDSRKKAKSTTRPRRRSEAEKRDKLEKQRKLHRDATDRGAHTNNRFLRALSAQMPNPEKKTNGADDEDEDTDTDTTTKLLSKTNTAPSTKSSEGIIVAPTASFSSWFQRSQTRILVARRWTEQLHQQEAAGLFVDEERKQFRRVEHSTLDRLEERLYRELSVASSQQSKEKSVNPTTSSLREKSNGMLMEELLMPDPQSSVSRMENTLTDIATASSQQVNNFVDNQFDRSSETKAPSLAMLDLYIDRVVLDDHPTFELTDRLAAQLRALYTAYIRMQQLQPWQLSLQRLDEFFSSTTDKLAEAAGRNRAMARTDLLPHQVIQEANQLLTDLEALSQLHLQIVGKANELRDAGTRAGSALQHRVKSRHRMQPIDLSRVEAILELLEAGTDNQQKQGVEKNDKLQTTSREISERLSTLSSASTHALQTVLMVESIGGDSQLNEVSFWSPRFYVVLRVNGKIACSTKIQPWSRGEFMNDDGYYAMSSYPRMLFLWLYPGKTLLSMHPHDRGHRFSMVGETITRTTSCPPLA